MAIKEHGRIARLFQNHASAALETRDVIWVHDEPAERKWFQVAQR